MPDHGRSPWTDASTTSTLADRVAGLLSADDPVALVGHSMGGKIAMVVALRHPELVERLAVVDVSPVAYDHADEFRGYIDAMRALDLDRLERRGDADEALREAVPEHDGAQLPAAEPAPRGDGWRWQLNLDLLGARPGRAGGWPARPARRRAPYDGPVLWLGRRRLALRQGRVRRGDGPLFPRNRRVTVKGAGHWVHSEQPRSSLEVLRRFVRVTADSGLRRAR